MEDGEKITLRQRLTIRDIAREVGVSIATVSRVMNKPETVAPATRKAVEAVIDLHGYRSHAIAVSLASQRSLSIGLVIPTITNSIYASSTQAIQRIFQDAGYTVLLGVSEFSPKLEEQLIQQLVARRVDGMILTGGERSQAVYDLLDSHGVPFILTWKLVAQNNYPNVSFDNFRGARLALDHLIELGHRRIALICGRTDLNDRARERRRAYEETMRELCGSIDPAMIHETDFELHCGREAMCGLLALQEPPTAVFCANDIQAIGALAECQMRGLAVPQDMSIVGFDDLPVAVYTRPQLTTIHVPAEEMGRRAATNLLDSIRTGIRPGSVELPVELIVRESAAPWKGA